MRDYRTAEPEPRRALVRVARAPAVARVAVGATFAVSAVLLLVSGIREMILVVLCALPGAAFSLAGAVAAREAQVNARLRDESLRDDRTLRLARRAGAAAAIASLLAMVLAIAAYLFT